MIVLLLSFVSLAGFLFFIPKRIKGITPVLIGILHLVAFLFFLKMFPSVSKGETISNIIEWLPEVNLNIFFYLDGLSLIFTLLICFIGFLVFFYAKAYMKKYNYTNRFYLYLLLFSVSMLGLVLSGNMIQLFLFWELTGIFSFFLISFFNEKESSRRAAFIALFITGFGGLCLLAGILLIGSIVGSYSIIDWLESYHKIQGSKLYLPALLLILTGAFSKSAQFPLHFWLPGAMQAPTPVSSFLHSATMVKAGVYLLMRVSPILGGTIEWVYIIPVFGVLTMLTGAYLSITQTDLKGMLAYTTISALGVLILLLGIDTKISVKAALVFLIVHAFYKASLFMITGYIDKNVGTRDIGKLGGLFKKLPLTFIFASLALFSMAGIPPMLGFIGKELIYEAKVQSSGIGFMILIFGIASNIFMVAVSLFILKKVFLGKTTTSPKTKERNGILFLIGPGILTILSLIFGLFPDFLSGLIQPALEAIKTDTAIVELKIWHGFNEVFFLSLFTVVSGTALFLLITFKEKFLVAWRNLNNKIFAINLVNTYFIGLNKFLGFAGKETKFIQHGYNRYYLFTVIALVTALLTWQLAITWNWNIELTFSFRPFYISGILVTIIASSIFSMFSKSRINIIIALGIAGYGISLIYLYYSAIDIAITQIIVETLTLVMFVIVLQRLPRFAKLSRKISKIRDLILACSFGAVMTILAIKATNVDIDHPISDYFVENSYIKAFGENVVNVILVDFRALDTLGEVTVLTIAAFGVYILIKQKYNKA